MAIAADINVEERNIIVEEMRLQLLGPSRFANNKPSFSIDLNVIPEEEKTMGQEREVGFVDLSSFGSHQLASPLDRNVIQFEGKFVAEGQVQSLDDFFITNQNPRITNQNPRNNIDLNVIPEEAEFATGGEQYTTSKVGSRRWRINRLMVNATTMPMSARRRKRCPLMSASSFCSPEIPSRWGVGWQIDYRVRYSGASAGKVDKYYVELESGRRFRSRKEVEYYREHGTIRKKKKGAEAAAAGAADVNSPADQETKPKPPPKKKAKKTVAPANFDYKDVPDMVQWRLTDASGDTWTPYVGGDKVVPAGTKKEWDSAFRFSCGL